MDRTFYFGGHMNISISRMRTWQQCHLKYWFEYEARTPRRTDYPRLCGIAVHRTAQRLYDPQASPKKGEKARPFHFRSMRAAVGGFIYTYRELVREAKEKHSLINPNANMEREYRDVGKECVQTYWKQNILLPRPLAVELRLSYPILPSVTLAGIFDQTRAIDPNQLERYVKTHRPELWVHGALHPDYDPVIIIDLKTEKRSFEPDQWDTTTVLDKNREIRRQFPLHEDMQAAAYSWLYRKRFGKWPFGYWWYHLRSGRLFFTAADSAQHQNKLELAVRSFIEGLEAKHFMPTVGRHCEWCDHIAPCRGVLPFFIASGEEPSVIENALYESPTGVIRTGRRQLALKLGVLRRKRDEPARPLPKPRAGAIEITEFQWDREFI